MRINLFTNGDCTDINTWSALPYYFYKGLRDNAVDVTPISLIPAPRTGYRSLRQLWALRARVIPPFRPVRGHDVLRSRLYHVLADRQLRFMARRHAEADLNVFLTFTFSSYQHVGVPVVHYCDRTYEHYLEEIGREPTRNDRRFIQIDRQNIENAHLVLTTGQGCLDFIKSRYKPKKAFCLRTGNRTDADVADPERLISAKERSTDVLFIGRGAHSRGVDVLIRAFKVFNERHRGTFTLHIVGVQPTELPEELRAADACIRFHGYLDRNIPNDLECYNGLLQSAKMFVMPMRPGPFPGVIREAQLCCTPVIASSASGPEILRHDYDSILVDSLEPHDYADQMDQLVGDRSRWRRLAWNGHLSRRDHNWTNTIQDFLDIVRESDLVKGTTSGTIRHVRAGSRPSPDRLPWK